MSDSSRRTPIPDRPGRTAIGRKAVLGAVICAIIGVGFAWALGTRIWQLVQPATVAWDDVPMADEIPPDLVNAILRGQADPSEFSGNLKEDSGSGSRVESRIAEERRLLGEMFPRHSESGGGSRVNEPHSANPVRAVPENRMAKIPNPIPDLEISIPDSEPPNQTDTVDVVPKSNSLVNVKPWRGAGDLPVEKPQQPKVSEEPYVPKSRFEKGTSSIDQPTTNTIAPSSTNESNFPPKFSDHSAVLPSASMRPPKLIQSTDVKPPVVDEQVEQANATSPLSVLSDVLADSVQKLERPPTASSVMVTNQDREEVSDVLLVTVEEDDSFWTISQRVYGDGNWFQAIYFENRDQIGDYDHLKAGQKLRCPSVETLREKYPNLAPALESLQNSKPADAKAQDRVYYTMAGDTLFGVARQQLGQASRYLEIAELNRQILGKSIGHLDPLPEGLKIVLPKPVP